MTATTEKPLDWLDENLTERREHARRELDREELITRLAHEERMLDRLAGDGIIYESSHGEWCKCWECRI